MRFFVLPGETWREALERVATACGRSEGCVRSYEDRMAGIVDPTDQDEAEACFLALHENDCLIHAEENMGGSTKPVLEWDIAALIRIQHYETAAQELAAQRHIRIEDARRIVAEWRDAHGF